jgi:hypothetical protein
MSIFDGIEHVVAEGTSNRQYFEPGNYIVTIDAVFIHERRLGGGKLFIVETTINESDNPKIKAGETRNWVQSLTLPSALPCIKAFIGAAMGLCPSRQLQEINKHVNNHVCEEAVGDKNPLRGRRLKVSCTNRITRQGKEFTHAQWRV